MSTQYTLVFPDPDHPERPCSECPSEIRDLGATAHNLLSRLDAIRRGEVGAEGWAKVWSKAEDLRAALKALEPLRDAHFADRRHSHGEER